MRYENQKRYSESQERENHTPQSPIPSLEKCTNCFKEDLKEQTIGKQIDKKEFGTTVEKLCSQLENAGVRPNKTIASLITTGAAAAVENALSALKEQQAKGTVRNPWRISPLCPTPQLHGE